MNKRRIVLVNKLMMMVMFIYLMGCEYNSIPTSVDCSASDLAVTVASQSNPTGCNTNNGSIAVNGSGGKAPYQFAINAGSYGNISMFNNLGAGTFTLTIKDANNCERSVQVTLASTNSSLAATASTVSNTECVTSNGSITVNATGGTSPYQYQLGNNAFGAASTFTDLKDGNYNIVVKDNVGCTVTVNTTVARGNTGVSYSSVIVPIVNANCATSTSCHAPGSPNGDWTQYANLQAHAALVKSYTAQKIMPKVGSLTDEQIALIGCWVDDNAPNN